MAAKHSDAFLFAGITNEGDPLNKPHESRYWQKSLFYKACRFYCNKKPPLILMIIMHGILEEA